MNMLLKYTLGVICLPKHNILVLVLLTMQNPFTKLSVTFKTVSFISSPGWRPPCSRWYIWQCFKLRSFMNISRSQRSLITAAVKILNQSYVISGTDSCIFLLCHTPGKLLVWNTLLHLTAWKLSELMTIFKLKLKIHFVALNLHNRWLIFDYDEQWWLSACSNHELDRIAH